MSPWWLLLIVPVCLGAGVFLGALCAAAGMESRRQEAEAARIAITRKEVQPVKICAQRDIPWDLWADRCTKMDAKSVAAWLRLSMAQQLAAEAAPHVAVRCKYHRETQVYRVSAAALVVPMEGRDDL